MADELRLCELYLGIEQLRLGSRLRVDWQVDAAARRLPMPPLVLQPLVENAVYHGVSQLPAGGTVRIVVQVQAGRVCATVENPLARAATGGHRMAVTNIEQRLQALFGSAADLQVQREDGHYRVQLTYPVLRWQRIWMRWYSHRQSFFVPPTMSMRSPRCATRRWLIC